MISAIFAVSQNGVIGIENKLPWNLPIDTKRFEDITKNHTVIMGRKTFESMNSPLSQRDNIIITRDTSYINNKAQIFNTIEDVLECLDKNKESFIIGGTEIFRLFMPYINKVYMTKIYKDYKGDTYLPSFDLSKWKITFQQDEYDKVSDTRYSFINYE